jgi:hypothetical protein
MEVAAGSALRLPQNDSDLHAQKHGGAEMKPSLLLRISARIICSEAPRQLVL